MKTKTVKESRFWTVLGVFACLGAFTPLAGCGDFCLFGDCGTQSVAADIQVTTTSPQTCTAVNLDGSGSTGSNLTYTWTLTSQPSGSTANLTSTNTATTSFTPSVSNPNDKTYTVNLVVKDDQGTQDSKSAPITVEKGPFADPGKNQTVLPGAVAQLDGSGSKNPDSGCNNSNLAYSWQVTAAVPITAQYAFDSTTVAKPKFTTDPNVTNASYTIQLTVTTQGNLSGSNTVTVTTAQ